MFNIIFPLAAILLISVIPIAYGDIIDIYDGSSCKINLPAYWDNDSKICTLTDNVIISNGNTITINDNVTLSTNNYYINISDGTLRINSYGTLDNTGTINIISGSLTANKGATLINSGTINIFSDGILNIHDNAFLIGDGDVIYDDGTMTEPDVPPLPPNKPPQDEPELDTESIPQDDTSTEDETKSGGGSSSEHKTRPTFGLDHTTYNQIVDNSFTHNLNTFNITDNWHTPFDIQNVTLGESNSFSAKVYAPYKLKVQEFLFGISEVGKSHNAELRIEIYYNQTGGIEETKIIQKTNVVDPNSLNATGLKVKCQDSDTIERCYLTVIYLTFLEPLKDDVMAIKAVDYRGRTHVTFLNEGFNIDGTSLNPMITKDIAGTQKHEGAIKITQTAKYSNIWIAEDGRIFESNESNSFKLINQSFERYMDSGEAKNRLHSEFNSKVLSEAEQAQTILVEICPSCTKEPFT